LIKLQGQLPLDGITISDEKIQRLREAGFSFELPKRAGRKTTSDGGDHDVDEEAKQPKRNMRSFDERLQDFIEWKNEHGTALVPQSMKGLGDWVHTQRRQYAKKLKGQTNCMSENRIRKLLAAGFIFDGNEARKQDAVAKQQKSSGDSEQQPSLHLETTVAAHQVVAMGHSDPNSLGWF
jgi:Helicase associated domain